jgi:hypothetical protein
LTSSSERLQSAQSRRLLKAQAQLRNFREAPGCVAI